MNIAIITGASSGIGEAFLREIIKERSAYGSVPFDEIWVIARRKEKLEALSQELDSKRIIPLVIDLAEPSSLVKLEDKLKEKDPTVGLLINCAGMGKRGVVEDKSVTDLEDTIDINCTCLTKVTRICLPYMISKNPVFSRSNGPRIINIASSAAFLPQPGFATYAASKAYVLNFSRALAYELKQYNIAVTTVCPGPVKTEFLSKATDNKESDFTGIRAYCVADPTKLAVASLRACRMGRKVLVYGFMQKLLHVASKILPTDLILWIETLTMNQTVSEREYVNVYSTEPTPEIKPTKVEAEVKVVEKPVVKAEEKTVVAPKTSVVTKIDAKAEDVSVDENTEKTSSSVEIETSEAAKRILGE
ncbi:MAG: SDR family NAD(P)-dependent oxidoreductase [Clostridia bacterium]|nr:SDR family NAD(P)-dependent oxidoreductase [Clostridia bacterium]